MAVDRAVRNGRIGAVVLAVLLVAGCANPRPAPVVNRTTTPPPIPQAQSPVSPGQPMPPGAQLPPLQPGEMPGQQPGQPPGQVAGQNGQPQGVVTSPIRSGSIESGGLQSGATPVDPNLKTGPTGIKRPFGEMAAVDPGAAQRPGSSSTAAAAPAGVTTTAPSLVTAPPVAPQAPGAPGRPAATAAPGGSGLLDGVTFAWPAAGTVLENFDETSSKGLSLGGKAGDLVRAAADGRVIFSGAGPRGYGNLIIVKHSNELLSVYAHNRSLSVKEGENVKRGQKIAELGNSGTDQPKLHFEIRQQGKPIDPLAVLPAR